MILVVNIREFLNLSSSINVMWRYQDILLSYMYGTLFWSTNLHMSMIPYYAYILTIVFFLTIL